MSFLGSQKIAWWETNQTFKPGILIHCYFKTLPFWQYTGSFVRPFFVLDYKYKGLQCVQLFPKSEYSKYQVRSNKEDLHIYDTSWSINYMVHQACGTWDPISFLIYIIHAYIRCKLRNQNLIDEYIRNNTDTIFSMSNQWKNFHFKSKSNLNH